MLIVNEFFKSIQGESTFAGLPFHFVRLTGCNLRCKYCDTPYAYEEGTSMTVEEIAEKLDKNKGRNVLITGGEPLLQKETPRLAKELISNNFTVLVETNGSLDIASLPPKVHRIVDFKCPSSGHEQDNRIENIELLTRRDEVKFVISDREDYNWVKRFISHHSIDDKIPILVSPVQSVLEPSDLASWILDDSKNYRLNLQLHRIIWPNINRGV